MTEIIELQMNDKKIMYNSLTRAVIFFTSNGVCMDCEMPKDWALTRIFQFMQSLINADSIIN